MSAHHPPQPASLRHRAKLGVVTAAILWVLGGSRTAAAEEATPAFAFSDCAKAPLGEQEFLRALRLEQSQDPARGPGAARVVEVRYGCDGRALVRMAAGDDEEVRRLYVHDVPPSERVRALALAVAELTREVRVLAPPPESTPTPEPTPAPEPTPERKPLPLDLPDEAQGPLDSSAAASPEAPAPTGALLGVALRTPLQTSTALLGAMAAYQGQHWSIRGSMLTTRRNAFDAGDQLLGSVAALMIGAQVGYQLWSRDFSALRLELELSAGGGLVRLWGTAHGDVSARDVYRPYVEARLGGLVRLGPRGRVVPFLELDAGRSTGVVAHADGREVLRTGGWFASGAIGLGF